MVATVAGCPRKYQTALWHREITFMPFIDWQSFKAELFFENLMWSNILHPLKTKINP